MRDWDQIVELMKLVGAQKAIELGNTNGEDVSATEELLEKIAQKLS